MRCQPLELVAVRRTPQEGLYDGLIAQYHYLGPAHGVGEQVKYLAFSQGRPLACLGFSCAPRHLGPRDRFIGWSPAVRRAGVHLLGYNTRFLILPWVRVPHLASHLLGAVARRIAADWESLYGHPVHYLETFVDPERFAGDLLPGRQLAGPGPDHRAGQGRLDPSPQPLVQARAGVAAARGLPPPPGGGGMSRRKKKPTRRVTGPHRAAQRHRRADPQSHGFPDVRGSLFRSG